MRPRYASITDSLVTIAAGGPSAITRPCAMHDDPVADLHHDVHVVLDEHDRTPLVAQRADVVEQRLHERRVHAGHRFVEHHELRVDHQRARHLEQLALATRHRARVVVALVEEPEARRAGRAPRCSFACSWRRQRRPSAARSCSPRWSGAASSMLSSTVSRASAFVSWNVRTMPGPGDAVRRPAARCRRRRTTTCRRPGCRSR